MNHISRKIAVGLVVMGALAAIIPGCTDRPTGPVNGPNVMLDVSYETPPSPKLLQQIHSARLTITGVGMDPIVVDSFVTDSGTFELHIDSVPSGPARVFMLELLSAAGVGKQSAQLTPVIYRGITTATVTPDVQITVPITLVPMVPMLKLTPMFQRVTSGSTFTMNLMAYNMPTAVYAEIQFYWGYFGYNGYLQPQIGTEPSNIPPGIFYSNELWNDATQYRVVVGDSSNIIPFTGPGATLLASVPFTTRAFTGDTVIPAPYMYVGYEDMAFLDSSFLSIYPEIYFEESQVIIDPIADRDITFPDTVLENAMRAAIYPQGSVGPIRLSDALRLTSFNGVDLNITNITGIDQVMNLDDLELSYTGVTDLRPVAGLSQLSYLTISSTGLTSLAGIENLKDLWYIQADGNQISNLSPLTNLPNIQSLYLANNNITDITPLLLNDGIAGQGDYVDLTGNTGIPTAQFVALRTKGVTVVGP